MKKIVLLSTMFFSILSFAQMVGNDRDAHGCIPSAGYTYSKVKNDCIQVFEQKIKLKGVKPKEGANFMATVVFSKDMMKVEVFLMEEPESIILTKQRKNKSWKNGSYVLIPYKKTYQLKKSNVVIYQ
ncbi:hypothetical protein [Chryseobacterium salviniae]|uniref:Uncharacterized protein n=1 Tax=Chryseobacterium salviniae TaxID=3101750 RepID=A0ABU6HUN4_9FLAO|nr:hypothetical protein [Chryseobacterium sp. T9W2-O]MEC3876756.1 hypothetical protein [Chryseobacterium sp. T9W2-O]